MIDTPHILEPQGAEMVAPIKQEARGQRVSVRSDRSPRRATRGLAPRPGVPQATLVSIGSGVPRPQ
jgi:hypothetical protein